MSLQQAQNPLDGVTLEAILTQLQAHYGWEQLGKSIAIKCFTSDPSIKSSLKFLRKTPWARKKVEDLYTETRFEDAMHATESIDADSPYRRKPPI